MAVTATTPAAASGWAAVEVKSIRPIWHVKQGDRHNREEETEKS